MPIKRHRKEVLENFSDSVGVNFQCIYYVLPGFKDLFFLVLLFDISKVAASLVSEVFSRLTAGALRLNDKAEIFSFSPDSVDAIFSKLFSGQNLMTCFDCR